MYVRLASFVLALALAAPALAQPAGGARQWSVLLGIEDGPGDSGVALRADLDFPQRRLSPTVGFSIVGSVGYTRFSQSGGYLDSINGIDSRWDWGVNLLKFGGAARFTFGHSQTVHPYADAGLGLYYAGVSGSETVYVGYPYYYAKQDYSDSDVGLFLRLAGGVSFQVSPGFALGVELGFTPYVGDIPDDTFTSLMASATFRL